MSYAKPAGGNVNYSRVIVPLTALALTAGCATKGYVTKTVGDLEKRTENRVERVVERTDAVESRVGTLEETTDNLARQPIVEGPISVTRKDYPREFGSLVMAVINQYESRDAKRRIRHAYREGNLLVVLAPHLNGETYSATVVIDDGNGLAGNGDKTVMDARSNGQTYGSVTLLKAEIPGGIRGEMPAIEPSSGHGRRHRR